MPPLMHNAALDFPLRTDARMLVTQQGTGVSSYARQLRRAHRAISADNGLLTDRRDLDQPAPAPFGRVGRLARALLPGARSATALPVGGETMVYAPDVFRLAQVYFDVHRCPLPVRLPGPPGIMHWTYPVPLTAVGWRNLYTVHDVIPLLHPALTNIDGRRYRRILDRLGESASGFIAVSETARDEIARTLGCDASFVTDCGLAVNATPADPGQLPLGLTPGSFLLVCGTVEKRKNPAAILAAYRASGVAMPLVLAGPDGWGSDGIAQQIASTPGVIRLLYVQRDTMHALIGCGRALLMPSLAEGFGLPVAEAMALGVPVITSNHGALAETAGGAALEVDPHDIPALTAAIRRIADDDRLCARLAADGVRNARRFRPDGFAERLTRAYAAVIAGPQ